MKVNTSREEGFRPITVSFTVESKEELEALFQVGNYATQLGIRLAELVEIFDGTKVSSDLVCNRLSKIFWSGLGPYCPNSSLYDPSY